MNISETIVRLLHKRGITDPKEIEEFLSPSPRKTYDPFLLKGMKEGVDLMLSEIKDGSRICIYGDYDADGVTSTALMLSILGYLTEPGPVSYTHLDVYKRQALGYLYITGSTGTDSCGQQSTDYMGKI